MKLDPKITGQLKSLTESEGLEFVATEIVGGGKTAILRLIVEGSDGVNLDQCAAISRQASAILDVEDPVTHSYTLEVSSPGMDRKLYTEADFDRFAGNTVNVRMAPSFRDRRLITGELLGLNGDLVRIIDEGGATVEVPYSEIFEARLEIDWDSVMKKGKSGR